MRDDDRSGVASAIFWSIPLAVFYAALLIWPMLQLARTAFANGAPHFDRAAWTALRNSVALSTSVAFASTLISILPAWILAKWTFRGKAVVRGAISLPITFSGVVVGFLAILIIGRAGLIARATEALFGTPLLSGIAYGTTGLILAYLYFEIPRATLALESAFRAIDPDHEAAAATLGAGPLRRMQSIILPITAPALVSTFLLTFAVSLGSYGVALLLSRRLSLLPVEIYAAFTGMLDDQRASALSLLLFTVAIVTAGTAAFLRGAER